MKKNCYILLAVGLMILIDSMGAMSYFQRSFMKVIMFGLIPYVILLKTNKALPNLKRDQNLKYILFLCFFIIFVVLGGAYVLNHFGLFEHVKGSLSHQVGVNSSNYPYVFIYIVLINGPLEEFFFRHFSYNSEWKMKRLTTSVLFSIYHVGMLFTMFDWYIFLLAIIGLIIVSLFFMMINTKKDSILNSVLVHMAANLAINIVGWFLIM